MKNEIVPHSLYSDGGTAKGNPSPIAGSWAYAWVDKDNKILKYEYGIVLPSQVGLPTISNNFTELLGALKALQSVPEGWKGSICTDSQVTYYRLKDSTSFGGVPDEFRNAVIYARECRRANPVLVPGHTEEYDTNNFVDCLCRRALEDYHFKILIPDEKLLDYGKQIEIAKKTIRKTLGIFEKMK